MSQSIRALIHNFLMTFPLRNLKTTIWSCIFLVYSKEFVDCNVSFPSLSKLSLHRANATGPEALAFDPRGSGPYTGVADGRILKYQHPPQVGFVEFATTSPNWTKEKCCGANGFDRNTLIPCGRPQGLGFDFSSGHLYVVDRHFGFMVVPPSGGLGMQLATGFNGTDFIFLNALDIDQESRNVYFTDCGYMFTKRGIKNEDTSGNLYKYNIRTGKLTLLLSGLSGPNGLAVSKYGRYLVISEYGKHRIQKYWVRGPTAFRAETLINLSQKPDNIKRSIDGDFWVALGHHVVQTTTSTSTSSYAAAMKFNGFGRILKTLDFSSDYNGHSITEAHEYSGKLYLGSVFSDFVGVYG